MSELRLAGILTLKRGGEIVQKDSSLKFSNYAKFLEAFHQNEHSLFTVAHRGIWGPAPENSIPAFQNCVDEEIYLIEMDFQKTKDGHLIILHDSTVDRMTNGTGEVASMNLAEIRSLYLKAGNGGPHASLTNEKIPTFSEVLSLLKDKAMINADKSWAYRREICSIVDAADAFDDLLIKSRQSVSEVLAFFVTQRKSLHYMHLIDDSNLSQLDELMEHCPLSAIEILFHSEDDKAISKETVRKIRAHTNVWCNALNDGENGGHNDSLSLMDPDSGWGWLLERGVNIIQTDHATKVTKYVAMRQKSGG